MRAVIRPSKPFGTVTAPPSKSMAHRLLICAGLSEGESVIRNIAFSNDVTATAACLEALGAKVTTEDGDVRVVGTDVTKPMNKTATLPCNECGSTLRFFVPLCLLSGEDRRLFGSETLLTRPLSVYESICEQQGLFFRRNKSYLAVKGELSPGRYEIPGNISSQFISGLLFALPLLSSDSELTLLPPVESKPYIDMTIAALRSFGVSIFEHGGRYHIPGNQRYAPADVTVEGDCSNAAFFEALNYAGGNVAVDGLNPNTLQGDAVYRTLFEQLKNNGETSIDISDCPDLGPILFTVAALTGGGSFTGTKRLKIKESDRAAVMRQELKKFGVKMDVTENTVTVFPSVLHAPEAPVEKHNDHRVVMSLSVLGVKTGAVIDGAEDVAKSFPDFFEKLKSLHADVSTEM